MQTGIGRRGTNVIINHDLRIIYLKTKKVGGTSFEIALSKYCDRHDIVTPISPEDEAVRSDLGFQGPANHTGLRRRMRYALSDHPNRRISGDFKSHIPAAQVFAQVGASLYRDYTKVAIHRDPLDQLISQYFFRLNKRSAETADSFRDWIESNHLNARENYTIAPISGPHAVDVVLSYEALDRDITDASVLPEGLLGVFRSLNAKGNLRPQDTRDPLKFFEDQGCSAYVEKIMASVRA